MVGITIGGWKYNTIAGGSKVSEYNDINYDENIITINISDETIKYQGTDDFPSCTMNNNTIIISNPHKYRVCRKKIKENSAVKWMKFTNDLIYIYDIDTIHNKIDAFAWTNWSKWYIPRIYRLNSLPIIDSLVIFKTEWDGKIALKIDISFLDAILTVNQYIKAYDKTYSSFNNIFLKVSMKFWRQK